MEPWRWFRYFAATEPSTLHQKLTVPQFTGYGTGSVAGLYKPHTGYTGCTGHTGRTGQCMNHAQAILAAQALIYSTHQLLVVLLWLVCLCTRVCLVVCTLACLAACTCVSRAVGRLRQPFHICTLVSSSHGLRMCKLHCSSVNFPSWRVSRIVLLRFQNVSCRSVSVGFAEKTSVFGSVFVINAKIVNFFMTRVIWYDFHHRYFEW